jgi:hypothetical protein
VARILNIAWVQDALEHPARIIARAVGIARVRIDARVRCPSRARNVTDIRGEILKASASHSK